MVNRKKNKKVTTKAKKKAARPRGMSVLADPRVAAWDRLLRDPCAADLAYPCYGGLDTGYLVRVTDFYTPSITQAAPTGATTMDCVFMYAPYNLSTSTGYTVAIKVPPDGTLPSFTANGFSNFISSSGAVKRYRPVACCVRWLPSGAYSVRSGTISSGVSPGAVAISGNNSTMSAMRAACQRYASNGSEMHEVRWLPTAVDENFTTTLAASDAGAGVVIFALQGIDAIGNGTTVAANGTFEITTVFEWVPEKVGAGAGVTISPRVPLPYTSQQVLGTIRDLGQYIFQGVRAMETVGSHVAPYAMAATQLLSGGVRLTGQRAPAMIGL